MTWVELVLLAVSLSFDTFAVSISGGICLPVSCAYWKRVEIWMSFAIFQTFFTFIGLMLGESVIGYIGRFDHWIAFGLLVYLGGKMIRDAFSSQEAGDRDCIDLTKRKTMVAMSVATSIDALAVGISLAMIELQSVKILSGLVLIFGITALASMAGLRFGRFIGNRVGGKVGAMGGLILVCIGIKVLVEHLLA